MLFEGKETIPLQKSFFPAQVSALGLRSFMPVRSATIGRLFRNRTAATRGVSTSIRATGTRATSSATAGSLFALSKGFEIINTYKKGLCHE